jgi:hypothetical protein
MPPIHQGGIILLCGEPLHRHNTVQEVPQGIVLSVILRRLRKATELVLDPYLQQ